MVLLNKDCRRAAHAARRIGEGHHRVDGRLAAVGDPLLGAVEDVGVPVGLRGRLDGRRVTARARLGEPEGGQYLPGSQAREVFLLLLVAAEQDDRDGAEARRRIGEGDAAAHLRKLLHHEAHLEHAAAQAIVFGRNKDAEEIGLGQRLYDFPGELPGLVELRPDGQQLLARDLRGEILDHLLVIGEKIVHLWPSFPDGIMTESVWFYSAPTGVSKSRGKDVLDVLSVHPVALVDPAAHSLGELGSVGIII